MLEAVDRSLVSRIGADPDRAALQDSMDVLTDTRLSHRSYAERQLGEPIARLGVLI